MTPNENVLLYWLSLSGAGSRKLNAVLSVYSPAALWEEIAAEQPVRDFLGARAADALLRFRNEEFLSRSLDALDRQGIGILPQSDGRFPERLVQREVDPPIVLYYKGDLRLLDTDCIAVVGTRACSRYGREMTERFTREFCAAGLTVVSGLATGVDMYAHEAALGAGGKTIAVLGSGLNRMSPTSNYALYERICAQGLVLSEYPPDREASRYTFPERNRIVSGLSLGVLVTEAPLGSGALITARFASDQDRDVFALPANLNSPKSAGCIELIRENGARFTTCPQDVLLELGFPDQKIGEKTRAIQLDIFQQKIYNILQNGEESFDALILKLRVSPQELAAALSALEIFGLIRKKQANIYGIE